MKEQEKLVRLKNYNRRTVLNYIRRNQSATKAKLASVTGLTFMAMKKMLEELEALGLIRSVHKETCGVGRKAISYAINENYKYTIGIHINKYSTSIALLNLSGEIVRIEKHSMEREFINQNEFVELITNSVKNLIEISGVDRTRVLGIGVGAPGPVDCENGIILMPPNLPILNYLPLKEILEKKTDLPVYVNKDTNVIALGEYWYGDVGECSNLVYIDVDMGIGSGLIIDGRVNVGANSIAGEFGHIALDINGPLCNCGNRGCLEAMSSGIAVLREMKEQIEKEEHHPLYYKRNALTMKDVFEMVNQKELLTISILNQSAFYMGVAVSNLINILDPEIIVLGGILIQNYSRYFSIVQDVANKRKVKGARENKMVVSVLKDNAGVVGAAEEVADHFFGEGVDEVFLKTEK